VRNCDILIIGAGVIGASIAYHLALKGIKNIAVVEKGMHAGIGSTSKATGGFRAQFGSEINIKLSLLSRTKLLNFKEETGFDPCYLQHGYLFLARGEDEMNKLLAANRLQKINGLSEAGEVSVNEIKKLNPFINPAGIFGGTFSPTDGFISPVNILNGYTKQAMKLGVSFLYGNEITEFVLNGSNKKITGVKTNRDNFSTGSVVNAAGPWAGVVALMAGCNLPVKPLKRQVACIRGENLLPANLPMTIFTEDSFHFRMRESRLIILLPTENEITEPFDTTIEESWLKKVFKIANERIPEVKKSNIDKNNSWAGLYEMSPDEHILLGLAPGFGNFFLANGSSGHGVMHSPAAGQLLAEIITEGRASTIDTHSIRPSRFIDGEPVSSINFF